jgi:flagellin
MVTSVQPVPYTPLASGLASQSRPQTSAAGAQPRGDSVETGQGYRTEISGARAALSKASGSLDLALAAGREAANIVSQMRDLARAAATGDDAARTAADQTFKALLQRYEQVVTSAIEAGASVLAGQSLSLEVDPDAPAINVQGFDLRLKADPGAEDVLRLSTAASLADASSAASAARDSDSSLARIDIALSRLSGASQKLAAHDGFLSALDKAVANDVVTDLDAEGARLTALQVRQTLIGSQSAIANAGPSALLSLFVE